MLSGFELCPRWVPLSNRLVRVHPVNQLNSLGLSPRAFAKTCGLAVKTKANAISYDRLATKLKHGFTLGS